MSDDFDPAQSKNSIELSDNLLPVARKFHDAREIVRTALDAAADRMRAAQERYNRDIDSCNKTMTAAVIEMRNAFIVAGLVGEATVFFLDTARLVMHGRAYIVKPESEKDSPTSTKPIIH